MNTKNRLAFAVIVLLALGAGAWIGRSSTPDSMPLESAAEAATKSEPKILYYRNPMGLPDTSPVPKKDSMGMDYIPVFDGEAPTEPGTVVLPPEKVQRLGVRTELARRERLTAVVRASASVEIDETRQFVIAPRFDGWIERLHANQTGMAVRRGQALMTLYSPELLAAQEEYRIADEAARRLEVSDPASAKAMIQLRDAARVRLRNWQVAGARLGGSDSPARLSITAPMDAIVIDKPVVEGDRFEAGQTVLRLADLSTVWVMAQVPVTQASELEVGQAAAFETPALPGASRQGQIEFIYPMVAMESRTVGVRLVLPNPDGQLRPGVYGEVTLQGRPDDDAVVVPRSAIVDSGTRQVVLVQISDGRYEPRTVRLGRRTSDKVAVLEGLTEGESVVVSANFLIDAESNLSSALRGLTTGETNDTRDADHDDGMQSSEHEAHDARNEDTMADPHAGHTGHGEEH